jgi:ribosomal peptide maturation radical SAM protein 1
MSVETVVPAAGMPAAGAATGEGSGAAQVALVYMPFGPVYQPPLGISLLKAILAERGIACDIHYMTLVFAERLGLSLYGWIGLTSPEHLLGEWLFARELFGREWDREHPYFGTLQPGSGEKVMPPERLELLRQARDGAGAYLDDCMSAVPWNRYRVIGFSSIGQQNVASLALAKRIKAAWPEKTIVFGGANCRGEMGLELHRRFPLIDFVCRGESDILFPDLVESLLHGQPAPSLPGLVSRGENGRSEAVGSGAPPVTDLDSLPYPDFDDYFRQVEESSLDLKDEVMLSFESSRGCWYGEKHKCTFCGLSGEATTFRRKAPGRVLEELTHLTDRYGVRRLSATDNILDTRYLQDLFSEIINRDLNWLIFYEAKANLRKEQLRLLKRAGVKRLQPGIESLSTEVLRLMRKGCTALQNVQLLKWASELGIDLAWNYLTGLPGEQPDEYARLAEMVPALLHLQPPHPCGAGRSMRLYRFSPYHDDPEAWGLTNVRCAANYGLVYPFPEASLRRLAYQFDFDYADGRDPSTYTADLVQMIEYWRTNHCPGALTSISDGQALVIHDRRPGAKQARLELSGIQKAAYEYCDEAHALQAVHRHLLGLGYEVARETLRHELEGWVEDRLMLSGGEWFLSLAVPADDLAGRLTDSDALKQALAATIAALGDTSREARLEQGACGETPGCGSQSGDQLSLEGGDVPGRSVSR